MKIVKFLFLAFLVNQTVAQEQVQYKIIADEPRKINNFSCNIDLAQMDFGVSNFDGASFNIGVWGHGMFKQKLGVDYTFRYGWLTFGKFSDKTLKNHLNIQLGGFFIFNQRTKFGSNKVILKSTDGGVTSDGRRITVTTFINVPSGKWKYKAVRGGIYLNRSILSTQTAGGDVASNYYIFGAYGGICFGSTRRIFIQTDKYGERGVVSHLRVCLDALITPINNVPSAVIASGVGKISTSPIGARLLVQALPTLQRKDRKKKYKTAMTAEVEVGYRMVDGIYFAGTLSIPISRSIKFLRGEEEDQTIKRTTE